jgi:hypothetical protein
VRRAACVVTAAAPATHDSHLSRLPPTDDGRPVRRRTGSLRTRLPVRDQHAPAPPPCLLPGPLALPPPAGAVRPRPRRRRALCRTAANDATHMHHIGPATQPHTCLVRPRDRHTVSVPPSLHAASARTFEPASPANRRSARHPGQTRSNLHCWPRYARAPPHTRMHDAYQRRRAPPWPPEGDCHPPAPARGTPRPPCHARRTAVVARIAQPRAGAGRPLPRPSQAPARRSRRAACDVHFPPTPGRPPSRAPAGPRCRPVARPLPCPRAPRPPPLAPVCTPRAHLTDCGEALTERRSTVHPLQPMPFASPSHLDRLGPGPRLRGRPRGAVAGRAGPTSIDPSTARALHAPPRRRARAAPQLESERWRR